MALPTEFERAIDQAIEQLRQTKPGSGQGVDDGLLYLGTWNDAYPALLVRDPFLTDSAKIQWLFLAQEARKQPHHAIGLPSIQKTAKALHHSRGTVIRDRVLLRICRWISAVRRIRDPRTGRFLGEIYAMHGEPVQLHSAIQYDTHYLASLDRWKDHQDKQVQHAARANLLGIQHQIMAGRDPLEPKDPVEVRITAARSLESGWSESWNLPLDLRSPGSNCGPGKNPGPQFEPGDLPSPKFGPGTEVIDFTGVQNLDLDTCSSSSSYTTTTTATGAQARARDEDSQKELQWPDPLDDNLRRLIHQALTIRVAIVHHQDVLDALAHKLRDPDDPLRSPVGYAIKLCERIKAGTFQPVGPPLAQEVPNASVVSLQTRPERVRNQLLNELAGLKQLRAASGKGAVGEALDRQMGDIEAKLRELGGEG